MRRARCTRWAAAAVLLALLAGACGDDSSDDATVPPATDPSDDTTGDGTTGDDGAGDDTTGDGTTGDDGPVANSCPPEGCRISLVDVAPEDGELRLTWEANFLPDMSGNHIHVYWDIYTAEQVTLDAAARGVEQGEWDPTDAYPTYVTQIGASTDVRGGSTTICLTAGDRDHNVLDPSLVECTDVAEHLDT